MRTYINNVSMTWLCLLTAELNGAGWVFLNFGYAAVFGLVLYEIEGALMRKNRDELRQCMMTSAS
jgi:hypothetical protein